MFQATIFDYDGVIIDSFDYHLREYNTMFPQAGLTAEEFINVHYGNFLERNNNVWSKIDITQYDNFLLNHIPKADLVFPGIKQLLENLKSSNFIVTSGPEHPLKKTLEVEEISQYFKGIYGKETHVSKVVKLQKVLDEYNFSVDDVVFVTDTLGDIIEANKVGIKSIAVTYGFHTREMLESGKPWKILDSVRELSLELL